MRLAPLLFLATWLTAMIGAAVVAVTVGESIKPAEMRCIDGFIYRLDDQREPVMVPGAAGVGVTCNDH